MDELVTTTKCFLVVKYILTQQTKYVYHYCATLSAVTRSENSHFFANFSSKFVLCASRCNCHRGVGLQSSTLVPKRGELTDTYQIIYTVAHPRG